MNPLDKIADMTYYLFHGLRDDSPTKDWFEVKLGVTGHYSGEGATLEEAIANALDEFKKDAK